MMFQSYKNNKIQYFTHTHPYPSKSHYSFFYINVHILNYMFTYFYLSKLKYIYFALLKGAFSSLTSTTP